MHKVCREYTIAADVRYNVRYADYLASWAGGMGQACSDVH